MFKNLLASTLLPGKVLYRIDRPDTIFGINEQQLLRILERRMIPGLGVPALTSPCAPVRIGKQARFLLVRFGQNDLVPDIVV